jgi:hypothetical protein
MLSRRLIPFLTLFTILWPSTFVDSTGDIHPEHSVQEPDNQIIFLELDGVELTLSSPFLPSADIYLPAPDDPVQVANILQRKPVFSSFSITAIPYGVKPGFEVFPPSGPGKAAAYTKNLIRYRRLQGGDPLESPIAYLFNQEVVGIDSEVFINIDVHQPRPVRVSEWVAEAGNRIWLLRVTQEIQAGKVHSTHIGAEDETAQLTNIHLSAGNIVVPSTSSLSSSAFNELNPSISGDNPLPFPSWWDGECDLNTYFSQTGDPSYPLGGEYRGVKACGPRPLFDNGDHALTRFNPGWWGVLEWECVELSMRFLYLAYGVPTYQANGNQVVTNYNGDSLIKINAGTPGFAPQPNDVLSMGPETTYGHTSVVTESDVDTQGNGTISVLEQNGSAVGERTYIVTNWEIQSTQTMIGWLHDPLNGDTTAPIGDILEPVDKHIVQTNNLYLEGWALDDASGLSSAQFIANYNGTWQDIGPSFSTTNFSYMWDWCQSSIPDGPVSIALRLIDKKGNQALEYPGLRHIVKESTCPSVQSCTPSADQVALFSLPDYAGDCQVLDIGGYPDETSFLTIGDDQTESILIGENVRAVVSTKHLFQGRRETITHNDPNLADNRVNSNALSSLMVVDRASVPNVPDLGWPEDHSAYNQDDSITLAWDDGGGASLMRAAIEGPSMATTSTWSIQTTWSMGSLPTGSYSWRVQGWNSAGSSAWSPSQVFTVSETTSSPGTSITAPYSDTLEGDTTSWIAAGLWHKTTSDSHSLNNSWWYSHPVTQTYNTNNVNFGSITSPRINLPVNPDLYFLEFWSKYDTESSEGYWDQRRVQISVDGGDFFDIYQMKDDPTGYWLKIRLDLSPYYLSGISHELRIRFFFTTVDADQNDYAGWYIDDVQVSAGSPEPCSDMHEPNDTPETASPISYGDSLTADICPGNDRDFYQFSGSAGDRIVVDVDAKSQGSPLDGMVRILDQDGTSVLTFHDDEVPGIQQDPHLGYQLPRDGSYYLEVLAWDTPSGTGPYTITLFTDAEHPVVASLTPTTGTYLPAAEIDLQVNTNDALSGVSHVQFLAFTDGWNLFWEDWDGTNGWRTTFDTSGLTEGDQLEFYARAFDWGGNSAGIPSWDLTLDFTHPQTTADPPSNPSQTTAVHLIWDHVDNLAGIRSSHIRYRVNSLNWATQEFEEDTREWWYIGEAGNTYTFRIRAIDDAGNIEPYLEGAQVSTSIPAIADLCSSPDPWDVSAAVNDNSFTSAFPLSLNWQTHNFCNPAAADGLYDVDWFSLTAEENHLYTINVMPAHESTAVVMRLYDEDGITLLADQSPEGFGESSNLVWRAVRDGSLYLSLTHKDGRVAGNAAAYQIIYTDSTSGIQLYFPIVTK